MPWDLGFHLGAFTRGLSAGGFATPGGQNVNVNLADPGFIFLNGGTFSGSAFANTSLTLASGTGLSAGGQLAVVDAAYVEGVALSHPCDVQFLACGGSDFEGLPLGAGSTPAGWTNAVGVSMAWTVHSAGTSSSGTGPTSASSGVNYAYCETSGAGANSTFILETCLLDTTALAAFTLDFALSRIGATIGTLSIYQDDGLGTFGTFLTSYSGADPLQSQGATEWSLESVPFTPAGNIVAFRFEYVAGTSFTGDLAIDNVNAN